MQAHTPSSPVTKQDAFSNAQTVSTPAPEADLACNRFFARNKKALSILPANLNDKHAGADLTKVLTPKIPQLPAPWRSSLLIYQPVFTKVNNGNCFRNEISLNPLILISQVNQAHATGLLVSHCFCNDEPDRLITPHPPT